MALPLTWLDVFGAEPLTGNPLIVVHDADELGEETMQRFARETRQAETTFVQRPTAAGADYRNRIFDTRRELPMAGHPSLGTAVAVAHRAGQLRARYVQQTPAGQQLVEVELAEDGGAARASMLQEPAEFGSVADAAQTLAAVGLAASDAHPDLPPQAISTGYRHLIAPVRNPDVLARCEPAYAELEALLEPRGCGVLYLAAVDPDLGYAQARSFYCDVGGAVSEDPATGSAAGPLCAYLHERLGLERILIDQGVMMSRPSRLEAQMDLDRVRVSGDVVILAVGEIRLPA
ncbi:MAG TPA: PhzF family phenazine biosynthesis protein [Solirubrobacteraceae bacterium]|nr:PhzF family phenazine biosynthesis protein [Solirubrobacteraceae bacterium]